MSDAECLFVGYGSSKGKIRTSVWVTSSFLSKWYDRRMKDEPEEVVFDEIWEECKLDFKIAKKCQNGSKLDESIFD